MAQGALGVPKRKTRAHLTLIPEETHPITYRFTIAVVGDLAKEFAQTAVESEFAEAYKPKSQGSRTPSGQHGESDAGKASEDDTLVLFCPTGPANKELARLRFVPCVHFSDALPLTRDKAQAVNFVVVLLFWRVAMGSEDRQQVTREVLKDFQSRMAEICHTPAPCRPYTSLMAFDVDGSQEVLIREFAEKQHSKVIVSVIPEDNEESIVDALQGLCEATIKWQRMSKGSMRMNTRDVDGTAEEPRKSCSCAVQ